ncbi:MAG TPA: type I-B CRISPR-associated protein Cas7/Cst2/DevR [Dictyoglomaceae bacterium]|nr:type I-B CRISPR-associated protein Cas7/Cst2/DevR [Dictyoglomaceae bacterium]HOL39969.1 type I-B CRISPR-associated protein Cas7/Cst2/DevR [Dictyoglomaceae bacterium]HPP16447.1 type I-B CRISPR-associated protein Cas7/Cst2/DevR [Dictyoglomaceae bacterium]HPU44181.1 type I-B CRISPR-associated protein Cas7/Cst2/DevR [Dictyoglomaceae bacterium]
MKKGGLTLTVVFEAMSLNYGEGVGNISELKKLTREGYSLTYMSRQALRYELFKALQNLFGVKEAPLTKEKEVIQFKEEANIRDYEEVDLFGYMKTEKKEKALTRAAVVRFSPAISLEPYLNDLEFGTNKNFADRINSDPNPFQFEQHYSLYTYTITIDLDRIGKDENENIELDNETRIKRVQNVLDALKVMNREIKGRIENLNPIFVIGGIYPVKNPFFLNRVKVSLDASTKRFKINNELLDSVLNTQISDKLVRDYTHIGLLKGYWQNEDEFKNAVDISELFNKLKDEVREFYASA